MSEVPDFGFCKDENPSSTRRRNVFGQAKESLLDSKTLYVYGPPVLFFVAGLLMIFALASA